MPRLHRRSEFVALDDTPRGWGGIQGTFSDLVVMPHSAPPMDVLDAMKLIVTKGRGRRNNRYILIRHIVAR
jgi:hypothetical protein